MPSVLAYHRPISLDEASELLSDGRARILAGGTSIVPEARVQRAEGVELVDLQSLGLDVIELGGGRLRLGAMVRVGDLGADEHVPNLIADTARRELPSTLRHQATVGGTVAHADFESVLVAALLVHDAHLEIHQLPDTKLGDYLAGDRRGLILGVTIDPTGHGAMHATGRTPADTPIVAALARATGDGLHLALTGVASTPILVDPESPTVGLEPPADFRGSSPYRLHLASVLAQRAITEVQ